jgi:hypothetical protein
MLLTATIKSKVRVMKAAAERKFHLTVSGAKTARRSSSAICVFYRELLMESDMSRSRKRERATGFFAIRATRFIVAFALQITKPAFAKTVSRNTT